VRGAGTERGTRVFCWAARLGLRGLAGEGWDEGEQGRRSAGWVGRGVGLGCRLGLGLGLISLFYFLFQAPLILFEFKLKFEFKILALKQKENAQA